MKFKHFESESGKTTKKAQMDGYPFGDRLLEDIMFDVEIQENGKLKVEISSDSEAYFNTLNTKHWLKKAKDFAKDNDLFSVPGSSEQWYLEPVDDQENSSKNINPTPISAMTGTHLINLLKSSK